MQSREDDSFLRQHPTTVYVSLSEREKRISKDGDLPLVRARPPSPMMGR